MRAALLLPALLLSGCATVPPAASLPAVPVTALRETEPVGTAAADAADDPAIWRNGADPAGSLIVATDKKAGLHVYGLDGKSRFFDPAGHLNNVDLIDMGAQGVIVAASDRNDLAAAKLRLYRLDGATARLTPLGTVDAGAGEAYGVCLAAVGDAIHAFSVVKDGNVHQIAIELGGTSASGRTVRSLKLATQPEGCVIDSRTEQLFVGEEDVGIWRFSSRADAPTQGTLFARTDGRHLVADVEGLALAPVGSDGGWLIASSQGDNAFALYRLPDLTPAGRFRIAAGTVGSVEETDGIGLALGDFGPGFEDGLFVAQDGENEPQAQNFKLVSWAEIRRALGI